MVALHATPAEGRPSGGGSGGGWRAFAALSVPAFAWEFLRRNPAYRAHFAEWSRSKAGDASTVDDRWGLRFIADPTLTAERAEVFWRSEVAPGIVLPFEVNERRVARALARPPSIGAPRRAEDGLHVRLAAGLQMLLRGEARLEGPLMVVLALDQDFGLRVRAVEVFERASSGRPPPRSRLTAAQRTRLARCLVALDGALRRDSYRAIAEELFGPDAVGSEAWRTASIRGVTIRLVRAGRALMEGGYLKLLRGGL